MEMPWLEALAPQVDANRSNYTTLASILNQFGATNSTGLIGRWNDTTIDIQSIVAKLFADGMSRVGYGINGGNLNLTFQTTDQYPPLASFMADPNSLLNGLITGAARMPAAYGDDSSNTTKLRWDMFISGYAYKADSSAARFAIVVLLAYVAIAGCHMAYMIWTRLSSDAWEDPADLIVLAALSSPPAPPVLANTIAGTRRNQTTRTSAGIRTVIDPDDPAREELCLVFEDDPAALHKGPAHGQVEPNVAYGAR